jgi:uncharacterized CHY-type Zn-finger protein
MAVKTQKELKPGDTFSMASVNRVNAEKVVEMPVNSKVLACGKCGREMTVNANTVLAFCRDCSAHLGVKR